MSQVQSQHGSAMALFNFFIFRDVLVYEFEFFHTIWLLTQKKFDQIMNRISCFVLVFSVFAFVCI